MNRLDKEIADALDEEDEALLALSEGPEHEFSPGFQAALDDLIRQAERQPAKRRRNLWRGLLTAAVVAVMLAGAMAATADYWCDGLKGFFVKEYDGYSQTDQIQRPKSDAESIDVQLPEDFPACWMPKYIPDGYSLESAGLEENIIVIRFSCNDENTIVLSQQERADNTLLDNEGSSPDTSISGFSATTLEKNVDGITLRTISWASDDSSFMLSSNAVSFDELKLVGESLIFVEGVTQ